MIKKLLIFFLFFYSAFLYADILLIEPDAGRQPILTAIEKAKSIDVILYGLTDPIFLQAFIAKQHTGNKVSVLLEPLPYKNPRENLTALKKLQAAGITLLSPNPKFQLTHQKTLIFDHQQALLMTFNLTKSTFKNQRNFAIWIDDPQLIREIKKVRDADHLKASYQLTNSRLIFSPDNSRDKILHAIQHAKKSINIYADNPSDYQTLGALATAARQGIAVNLLMSKQHTNSHIRRFQFLENAGVHLCFHPKYIIHAKVIIIDQREAILGSINLTKPSLDFNRELAIQTADPHVITPLIETFNQDWAQCLQVAAL